ncbi:Subtilisin-like protein [Mycena indigotica]|uniref:Subtilisin-like protein n=1 Tax=Mycena indigotica TaxID=2126181 RepID=A0A8H6VTR0_9AGAR|nr:Subtilisin-like protein [Mycena indigotica]KAF7293594.1 Subtilisin-like protein [Mycena indigotica]
MSPTTSFAVTSVDEGTNSQTRNQAGIEADLRGHPYTVGLATGVPVNFVSVGTRTQDGPDEGFLDIVNALLAEAAPPQVLTISYGLSSATFLPTFPTCAFITLVGATENVPEHGSELSAGGFSNYFAQELWQSTAVNAYLAKLGTMFAGKFNASGHAFPDVSAQGQRVQIVTRSHRHRRRDILLLSNFRLRYWPPE